MDKEANRAYLMIPLYSELYSHLMRLEAEIKSFSENEVGT